VVMEGDPMRVLIALDDSEQAATVVEALMPWLLRTRADVHLVSVVDLSHVESAVRAGEPAYEPAPYSGGMGPRVEPPLPRAMETHGQALERARNEREEALIQLARAAMEGLDPQVQVISDDDVAGTIASTGWRLAPTLWRWGRTVGRAEPRLDGLGGGAGDPPIRIAGPRGAVRDALVGDGRRVQVIGASFWRSRRLS
jgi:nucleotide-binding universal stress UspA family protein